MCTWYGLDRVNHLLQNLFCFEPCIKHPVFDAPCSGLQQLSVVFSCRMLTLVWRNKHHTMIVRRHYHLNVAWDYANLYTAQSGKMFESLIHSFGRERCDLCSKLNKYPFVGCQQGEKNTVRCSLLHLEPFLCHIHSMSMCSSSKQTLH